MKFEIERKDKVKQFALIFRHAKLLCENVNLYIYNNGLYIQGMTGCHTSLFELKLSNKWFTSFECDKDTVIGVNCELLFKCIDCLQEGQKIVVYQKKDRLCLEFTHLSSFVGKTIEKKFEMPLISIEQDQLEIPDEEYGADILIDSTKFSDLINDLSIFGENIKMSCIEKGDESTLKLTGSGLSTGSMIANLKEEDMIAWAREEDLKLNLEFSTEHLKNICQFSKINNSLLLSISENLPLRVSLSLSNWMDKIAQTYPDEDVDKKMLEFSNKKEELKKKHPKWSDDKISDEACSMTYIFAEVNTLGDMEVDQNNSITFYLAPKIQD